MGKAWTFLQSFSRERKGKICSWRRREKRAKERKIKKLGVTSIIFMIFFLNFIDFFLFSLFHERVDVILRQ
jgi:hypothetical protein